MITFDPQMIKVLCGLNAFTSGMQGEVRLLL